MNGGGEQPSVMAFDIVSLKHVVRRQVVVFEMCRHGAEARHAERFIHALLDQVVPGLSRHAGSYLTGEEDPRIRILGHLPQAVAGLEVAEPPHGSSRRTHRCGKLNRMALHDLT